MWAGQGRRGAWESQGRLSGAAAQPQQRFLHPWAPNRDAASHLHALQYAFYVVLNWTPTYFERVRLFWMQGVGGRRGRAEAGRACGSQCTRARTARSGLTPCCPG